MRLPKAIIEVKAISDGSAVLVHIIDDNIVISPIKKEADLESLFEAIKPDTVQTETIWGEVRGKEIW